MSRTAVGVLLVAVSALGFSTLAIFGKAAYEAGGNPVTVLAIRFLVASLLLWAYLLATGRPVPERTVLTRLALMGGLGYTAMSILFLSAVERISPGLAGLLLYTYPAIVTLLAWWFDGWKLNLRQLAALGGALAGTAVVLLGATGGSTPSTSGIMLALGASAVYSVYIIVGSRVIRSADPVAVTATVCTAAALVFGVGGALTGTLVPMALNGWLAAGGMAIFATVVAVLCFFMGMERLGPSPTSVISTLEPVGTVLLSAWFFGETLTLLQVGGGLLVIGSIVALQWRSVTT